MTTDPLIIAGALVALALAALAAALCLRPPGREQALETVESKLGDLSLAVDSLRAAARAADATESIAAMRDDLSFVSTHLSALTSGRLDMKHVVDGALQRHLAGVLAEMDDAEGRMEKRLHALRDRLEVAVETAMRDSADADAPPIDPAALRALGPALERVEARLAAVETALAAADGTPPAETPRKRAPRAFDAGRVVTLVAPAAETGGAA